MRKLNLTASAGVAPNKFLAKIASDWKKPDGLFVIQPHEVESFLVPLPVGRIPGVGQVTEARMKAVGIATVGDLCAMERTTLESHFGGYGRRLYELARGIDHNPVIANRASKSISAEDTFPVDIPLPETEPLLRKLAEKVWAASRQNAADGEDGGPEAEDEGVQHADAQPDSTHHAGVAGGVRRCGRLACKTSRPRPRSALPPWWAWD